MVQLRTGVLRIYLQIGLLLLRRILMLNLLQVLIILAQVELVLLH
nr:MAG TPA: hypothetical protein [Caudoviricetes sp.]